MKAIFACVACFVIGFAAAQQLTVEADVIRNQLLVSGFTVIDPEGFEVARFAEQPD